MRVWRRLLRPNFLWAVNLKYVKLGYHYLINHDIYLAITPVLVADLLNQVTGPVLVPSFQDPASNLVGEDRLQLVPGFWNQSRTQFNRVRTDSEPG